MKPAYMRVAMLMVCLFVGLGAWAQEPASITQTASAAAPSIPGATVPRLIEFTGALVDRENRAMTGPVGVTFALYAEHTGGAALWMETQNVHPGTNGNYTVLLGVASKGGVPEELFAKGEARWLGIQVEQQSEQPRVLLTSVPYSFKAGDAETLGGRPASDFALASAPPAGSASSSGNGAAATQTNVLLQALESTLLPASVGGTGTTNFIPIWTSSTTLGNSALFQTGGKVGIGNMSPGATLDVTGGGIFRGSLQLPATGTATSAAGFNSNPLDAFASVFNSTVGKAQNQLFRWQVEPLGNNTATSSGKLNLLFGANGAAPAETGLSISSKGLFTFATGQAFPGAGTITGVTPGAGLAGGGTTGNVTLSLLKTCANGQVLQWNGTTWVCGNTGGTGTITGVTAGTGLSGGGTSGNVTLNLASNACAAGHALTALPFTCTAFATTGANTFTGNQMVTGNISDTGNLSVTGTLTGTSGSLTGNSNNYVLDLVQKGTGSGLAVSAGTGKADGIDVFAGAGNGIDVGMVGNGTGIVVESAFGGAGIVVDGIGGGVTTFPGEGIAVETGGSGDAIRVSTFSGFGIHATTSTGTAVYGETSSITNFPEAIHGLALSDLDYVAGVKGGARGTTKSTVGVLGFSMSSIGLGVLGQAIGPANVTTNLVAVPVGVWGDTSGLGTAVLGTADAGDAIEGFNNSDTVPTLLADNFTASSTGVALRAFGHSFGGQCDMDVKGNLKCTGTKSAVVPVDGGSRKVALYAVEAAENWFEDAGSAQLSNGSAIVTLEPTFAQTVNTGMDYHVFLTPNGDCKGLFVAQKAPASFVVRELGGGTSNIAFDYRIMARRQAYENTRLADATEQFQNLSSSARRESTPLQNPIPIKPYKAGP